MFLASELDAKVIDYKGKRNGASGVAKEAVGVGGLNIAVRGKVGNQFVIGKMSGLGKPVHAFDDADENVAIVNEVLEIALGENGSRDLVDWDSHVLEVIHFIVEVEVLDVNGAELCIRHGEDAVKEEFGGDESSSFGADIAGIVDAIASDGKANATRFAFVGAVSNDKAEIGRRVTRWNIGTLDEVDCIGADRALVALRKAANFFHTAFLPEGTVRTVKQVFVLDEVASIGVDCFVACG